MMMQMAKMDMRMGAPALKINPKKDDPQKMMENWGMQMKGDKNPDNDMPGMNMAGNKEEVSQMDHSSMDMSDDKNSKMDPPSAPMAEMPGMENMDMFSEFNYKDRKSVV